MTRLVVCAALGMEARAVSRDGLRVVRTGMGPARARAAAERLPEFGALAVAGCGGALDARLRPGDLFVATEVRGPSGTVPCRFGPVETEEHTVTVETTEFTLPKEVRTP
ncbi:hypothetical protein [Actinomadura sp. GTD37]|uniref:phosphorylase family protein n=1 Tax=Actinomadura sp. GTD37 TaxID=1778030 RepID=UPI0035C1C938